jgi:hypothetical protein
MTLTIAPLTTGRSGVAAQLLAGGRLIIMRHAGRAAG